MKEGEKFNSKNKSHLWPLAVWIRVKEDPQAVGDHAAKDKANIQFFSANRHAAPITAQEIF